MRVLAALVLIVAAVLIGMTVRGDFGPAPSPAVRASARPSSTSASATPTASGPRTITVTLTEQDLTNAAQGYMPLTVSGITVTDPKITLEPGRFTLVATGRAFIVSGPIVVVASPLVSNGTAAAKIESAMFAGLNLPDSTKQNVADTFARVLAASIPSGMRVTKLTVNTGVLVVEAVPA